LSKPKQTKKKATDKNKPKQTKKKATDKNKPKQTKKKTTDDKEEISFSSLDHILTPNHKKLSDDEIDDVLKIYNLKKAQLPAISLSDPAIKHESVQSGDVIKITRSSPTSGETHYYRMVIGD